MSLCSIEVEPEVEHWLESLPVGQFATVASRIEYLTEHGAATRIAAIAVAR